MCGIATFRTDHEPGRSLNGLDTEIRAAQGRSRWVSIDLVQSRHHTFRGSRQASLTKVPGTYQCGEPLWPTRQHLLIVCFKIQLAVFNRTAGHVRRSGKGIELLERIERKRAVPSIDRGHPPQEVRRVIGRKTVPRQAVCQHRNAGMSESQQK